MQKAADKIKILHLVPVHGWQTITKVEVWTHFCMLNGMSSAFVKEQDEQWLHEVTPTLPALIHYLTRENNGIRVYEQQAAVNQGHTVHHMSNGLTYYIDEKSQWTIQW